MEEDSEAHGDWWWAYLAFTEFHMSPLDYAKMNRREKTVVLTFLAIYLERKKEEDKKMQKANKKSKRGRRR